MMKPGGEVVTYDANVALGSLDVNTTAAPARIVDARVHDGSAGVWSWMRE